MNRAPFLLFLLFFVGSFVFVSCGKSDSPKKSNRKKSRTVARAKFVKPTAVSQGYVGSEACRQCHAEIMKEYESHPMSISMSVTKNFSVEDYSTGESIDAGKGAQWTATKQADGKVVHQELLKDADGKKLADHEETIDYTCGSGTRGCSYFVFESGKLFQSPVTWFSKKKKWDLSPGFVLPHHPRFERTASDGCLACHAGRMNPVENERNTYVAEKPFHELAIGCERCHGPGQAHIDFHEQSTKPESKDPIVNPDDLSPEQREAVCYQCHLQGERRITRYGRSEFDFRPGMHVSDVWITFLKSGDTSGGRTEAVSQVEQMHSSQCYIQSKGEFGCISCHDPHRSPSADEQITFYRNKCIACHQGESDQTECTSPLTERKIKSPKDSCVQCHMPKLEAGDVAHTPQTDHRVHIPGDQYQYDLEKKDGFRIWNDTKVPISEIERAKTIAMSEEAFLRHNSSLADKAMEGLRFFHPVAEDDLPLQESMAQLFSAKGDPVEASRIWTKLLKMYPRDEYLLGTVSLSLHEEGKFEEAYPIYRQLYKVNDRRPQVLFRYLDVCTKLNKFNEGMGIAKRILELDPGAKIAHQWLAKAYEVKGEMDKSRYHMDMSKRIKSQ